MPVTTGKAGGRRPQYTDGAPAQDGVNLGTVARAGPRGTSQGATASNLDTQSRSRDRSMSVHAVEFSKTVAPLQEGVLPQGRSRVRTAGPRGGPTTIALTTGLVADLRIGRGRPFVGAAQDTTWTLTVRSRGRSSKSSRTICCQVPSISRPSTTGIVSDGPINDALWWACELESWLSRLCS
jgi:hypothetical protein